MTQQLVEAVLIAPLNRTNYKAVYGRLGDDTPYTQDYIQIRKAVAKAFRPLFGVAAVKVDITYVWPGGTQPGHLTWSSDRIHLKWDTDSSPLPWRLGNVGANPATSLPGDVSKKDVADADAQAAAIDASGTKPWLLAVKLKDDGNRLHLRVYFEKPPPQLSDRGINQLPNQVQQAIGNFPKNASTDIVVWSTSVTTTPPKVRAKKLVDEILAALARDPNVLLVGPPGTGKTVALEDLRALYSHKDAGGGPTFDPTSWPGNWSVSSGAESRSEWLVFHPSYTYENFVAGLFPKSSTTGGVQLEAKPGPLLCLSHWVGDMNRRALLVLDEFNRGPAAAIFGDTLGLLDVDKRSGAGKEGAHIQRPYPDQDMPVPKGYRRVVADDEEVDEDLRLPSGVHIIAAMNSTDRSVAPLDAALRRRFTVIRVGPDYDALAEHLLAANAVRASQPLPASPDPTTWNTDDVSALAVRLLRNLNERIEYCLGEDFLLGHALVWGLDGKNTDERLTQLAHAVDTKVVPTLRMTFVDQDEALSAVLGIPDTPVVSAGQAVPNDSVAYWKKAPPALESFANRRLAVQKLADMAPPQQLAALVALAKQ